jgi:hypothetical protein
VCVDIFPYTVQQLVLLYESYVKRGSARNCRGKFLRKFSGNTLPSNGGIHGLNRERSSGLLLHNKSARKRCVLTEEKLDEIGAMLEHKPQKSLRRLAQ